MDYKTEQEEFWSGSFGDEYIDRNKEGIINKNISSLLVAGKVLF